MRIRISRAPVLTLWSAAVAERQGYDRATALTFGKTVAGFADYAKAKRLGLAEESRENPAARRERDKVATAEVMGKRIPIVRTKYSVRASDADGKPISAVSVETYLVGKFGAGLGPASDAKVALAKFVKVDDLPAWPIERIRREMSERSLIRSERKAGTQWHSPRHLGRLH